MLTAREGIKAIGLKGTLSVDGLRVTVRVIDAREVWGRIDLMVRPVSGDGEVWVAAYRVTLQTEVP